jgi:methionyl-tRNA formyltransferase
VARSAGVVLIKRMILLTNTTPASALPSSTEEGSLLASKTSLAVVCGGDTLLQILSIQPEGRKAVSGMDFANGARIQPGEKFESLVDIVG